MRPFSPGFSPEEPCSCFYFIPTLDDMEANNQCHQVVDGKSAILAIMGSADGSHGLQYATFTPMSVQGSGVC